MSQAPYFSAKSLGFQLGHELQQGFFDPFPDEPTDEERRNIAKAAEIMREAVNLALERLTRCESEADLQDFIAAYVPYRGIDLMGFDGQATDPAAVIAALQTLNAPSKRP